MKKNEWIQLIIIYSLLFITYLILIPKVGHGWDSTCWKNWMQYGFKNGLENVYDSGTDYLPLYHYILYGFAKFQGSEAFIDKYWYLLKSITLLFDFGIAFFIFNLKFKQTSNFDKSLIHSLFYSLNIFILFNTLVWGQVDSILAFFTMFSIYYA